MRNYRDFVTEKMIDAGQEFSKLKDILQRVLANAYKERESK
jgi:hypothetical protein